MDANSPKDIAKVIGAFALVVIPMGICLGRMDYTPTKQIMLGLFIILTLLGPIVFVIWRIRADPPSLPNAYQFFDTRFTLSNEGFIYRPSYRSQKAYIVDWETRTILMRRLSIILYLNVLLICLAGSVITFIFLNNRYDDIYTFFLVIIPILLLLMLNFILDKIFLLPYYKGSPVSPNNSALMQPHWAQAVSWPSLAMQLFLLSFLTWRWLVAAQTPGQRSYYLLVAVGTFAMCRSIYAACKKIRARAHSSYSPD